MLQITCKWQVVGSGLLQIQFIPQAKTQLFQHNTYTDQKMALKIPDLSDNTIVKLLRFCVNNYDAIPTYNVHRSRNCSKCL
jgi:hypothetical protein